MISIAILHFCKEFFETKVTNRYKINCANHDSFKFQKINFFNNSFSKVLHQKSQKEAPPHSMSNQEVLVVNDANAIDIDANLPGDDLRPLYLSHEHFSCSDHEHSRRDGPQRNPAELWEANTYLYEFSYSVFFKSIWISLLYVFGLGPLVWIYQLFFDSKFISNFHRGGSVSILIILFGILNTLFIGYGVYQKNFFYTDANSLSYVLATIFLSIIGACLNSFQNEKVTDLMNTVEFSKKSEKQVAPFFVDLTTKKELKRTILRLNFDASSFFMGFLENFGDELKRQLWEKPDPSIQEEDDRLVSTAPIKREDLVGEAIYFERAVFTYKFQRKPSRHDNNKAHGYTYAENVIEAFDDTYGKKYLFLLFGLLLVSKVAVSFIKLDFSGNQVAESTVKKYAMNGVWMILNAIVSLAIFYIISQGVQLLLFRLNHVEGMKELISQEKPPEDSLYRKGCSMINIFDFESLRTWASLRMVFMNMNERRLEAVSLAISIILGAQVLIIAVLGFFYFSASDANEKDFYFHYVIFFGAESAIYIITILLFVYIGAQVNGQYQDHIYVLKDLKTTICTLFKLYPNLIGEDAVQPSTYIYARGVSHLRKILGNQEVTQELLDEKLQNVTDAYDTIISELETEEQFYPLKILGIPMTESFVTTVLGSIVTVAAIPISSYLSNLTGWG